MSEDHSNQHSGSNRKGFFALLLNQLFHDEPKSRDELLQLIIEFEQKKLIDVDTREMLEGVLEVAEQRVCDIMVPRSQMITLQHGLDLPACLAVVIDSAHSRFPVISEDKGHVEGILMAKDLLPFMHKQATAFNLDNVLRPAIVVPESKRVDRMLKEFRSQRHHMAIVVDEFGEVSGLITIEDILELIVGNIDDEYDDEEARDIVRLSRHTYSVSGLIPIEDFNKLFNTHFSDQSVDTIGGLVMLEFGHLPAPGDSVEIDGYLFKVTTANSRCVIQVSVKIPQNTLAPQLNEV